nr:MAG: carbon starvation protein A [Bacillota bacterium]
MNSPAFFVLLALVGYAIAYWGYGKWFDRTVWKPDPKRTTPAHMYTDGVEYFPVSKYVLWGYQYKSIAALGPILGPFVALQYGWAPALAWIILGNFFIGWLQDYGAIMLSVRNQGRSFGPITYEFTGNTGRATLLGFILFYLLIISATFIFLIARFWNIFPGAFAATMGIILTGVIVGQLMYRVRLGVGITTLIAFVLMIASFWIGTLEPFQWKVSLGENGAYNILFWSTLLAVFLYLASILPLPFFIQPINYVSFFPAFAAVIFILLGALITPFTGVTLAQPAFKGFMGTSGPMYPILFVSIACGAISGWHSLVSSSSTAKQLDVETDAHPIGAGAMLSEGLLALASLAAYMVLSQEEIQALGSNNVASWVYGATLLTRPFLGWMGENGMQLFYATVLVIFAITVQALITRFWRLVSAEVFGDSILGQKHVATLVGLLVPLVFANTGTWSNLWLYFGGSNQLLAGLALMLITIHLARVKEPSQFTLVPAVFMIVTTLAAIAWQAYDFYRTVVSGGTKVMAPWDQYKTFALTMDIIFIGVGVVLFVLGLRMALMTLRAYRAARAGTLGTAPTAATGDD